MGQALVCIGGWVAGRRMGVSAASDRGCEWLVRGGLGGAISLCLEGTVWNLIDVTLTPADCTPCKNRGRWSQDKCLRVGICAIRPGMC